MASSASSEVPKVKESASAPTSARTGKQPNPPEQLHHSARSPRKRAGKRIPISGIDIGSNSTLSTEVTSKSFRASTCNYNLFIHEKIKTLGNVTDSIEAVELTTKLIKFLKENRLKVPKFLLETQKASLAETTKMREEVEEEDIYVNAKDRIKRYQGDKQMGFLKSYLENCGKKGISSYEMSQNQTKMVTEFTAEGVDCEDKGEVKLRQCQKCSHILTENIRICDCGGTLVEFTTKFFRIDGQIIGSLPGKR